MHETTTAGSESNGHTASGGDAMVISSRIEIMTGGYRQLLEFVDVFMERGLGSLARAAVEVNCPTRRALPLPALSGSTQRGGMTTLPAP
jgi:hypothetical protein